MAARVTRSPWLRLTNRGGDACLVVLYVTWVMLLVLGSLVLQQPMAKAYAARVAHTLTAQNLSAPSQLLAQIQIGPQ